MKTIKHYLWAIDTIGSAEEIPRKGCDAILHPLSEKDHWTEAAINHRRVNILALMSKATVGMARYKLSPHFDINYKKGRRGQKADPLQD